MNIKFLIMDVDGTLTDGMIYMSATGELFKGFNVKDGYAIKDMLPCYGIEPIILTSRESGIVKIRSEELGIKICYQGKRDKRGALEEILRIKSYDDSKEYFYSNIAYIGDDLMDLECMNMVKDGGGFVGCPADSIAEVKQIADYVCTRDGGKGAVREFVEFIISKNKMK